jgi:hypothetical protein
MVFLPLDFMEEEIGRGRAILYPMLAAAEIQAKAVILPQFAC